jgi:oxalate decarboxylase/phosphoglucose isomerase-like protein (cupin superfamily)
VFVPRGTPHCFANSGEADARILVLFTPAGMERFATASQRSRRRVPALRDIGAEVGMDVVGPPLRADTTT